MNRPTGSILVVDDDEAVLDVFTRILETAGYPVIAVKSIEDAKANLEKRDFAIVLYDLSVGGTRNALELASAIQEEHPGMIVLMVTGLATPEVAAETARRGLEILEKPFGAKELVDVVSCCLARKKNPAA